MGYKGKGDKERMTDRQTETREEGNRERETKIIIVIVLTKLTRKAGCGVAQSPSQRINIHQ